MSSHLEHLAAHLAFIYPREDSNDLANSIMDICFPEGTEASLMPKTPLNRLWSEKDVMLITYGDSLKRQGQKPLQCLKGFLDDNLKGLFNSVHLLPFFPFTSDDGFAVSDYDAVREDLGDWEDISAIAEDYEVMADVVINHASASHNYFQQFEAGQAPGKDYFKTASPDEDLSEVVRPRPFELLRPTETPEGLRYVWCTFSHDQVDWDFGNPAVLLEFIRIFKSYIDHGVHIFRVDAVAFLWKVAGTNSLHLPQTHEVIKLFRTLADMMPERLILITETNVPNHENLSYFGNQNEAHAIYNFSLPPLLVHALITGVTGYLRQWLVTMPPLQEGCSYLNFTASHDGIGLRPVEGLLPPEDIDLMLDTIEHFGGKISTRAVGNGEEKPYEMNIALFDALKGTIAGPDQHQVSRFLASQTVMMGLEGMPGFYIHSLLATPNDTARMKRTGRKRSINRHRWNMEELDVLLADPRTPQSIVFEELKRRIGIRVSQPAFHPYAPQFILQLQPGFFGFRRHDRLSGQNIYCITNMFDRDMLLPQLELGLEADRAWVDLLTDEVLDMEKDQLTLTPYQTLWLSDQISPHR